VLLDGDEWQAYFHDFKRSAFRLETHQVYTMPNEKASFARFLAGGDMPPDHNAGWHETIRGHVAAGRTMTRAKIVRQPFTDYIRYGLAWAVPTNVAAGEDYRIIDITHREVDLPIQDFWMFDEAVVVHLNYRVDGTQINRELVESPELEQYLRWRDTALKESVPFSEYRPGASGS
jgi:uncharacterized protein DUF6879